MSVLVWMRIYLFNEFSMSSQNIFRNKCSWCFIVAIIALLYSITLMITEQTSSTYSASCMIIAIELRKMLVCYIQYGKSIPKFTFLYIDSQFHWYSHNKHGTVWSTYIYMVCTYNICCVYVYLWYIQFYFVLYRLTL